VKFFPVEIVAFFISAGCLLLTGSRGGVGAFALSFAALLIWRGRGGGGASRFSRGLLIAIAFALLAVSGGFAIERYFAAAYAEDARPIWAVLSFKLFQTAPLEGFGLGSFPLVLRALTSASNYGVVSWAGSAHNLYLQWLLEAGVLGSIPMAGLLVWLIWTAGDHMPTQGASAYWRPTLLVCVVMVLVHSFVEYSLQEPSIAAYFSLILGAAMGFASMRRGRGRRKTRVEARAAAAAVGAGDVGVAKTASDKTPSAA
jgi:O-antigen ligase